MSRGPHGVTTPDQRDQAADDLDETALLRDRAGAARDRAAADRDGRSDARLLAAEEYVDITRRLLDAAAHESGADQPIARDLLRNLEERLADADRDRRAAASDRRAAAADRKDAAEDRAQMAAHRGQAAIERALRDAIAESAVRPERWDELQARARRAIERSASWRHRS